MFWETWFRRRASTGPGALAPDEAYARWASEYPPSPHNPLMEAEQLAVLDLLGELAGRVALDAGCGTGRYLRQLAARGALMTGVDRSTAMLSRATEVSRRLVRGDLRGLPLSPGSFDLVVCALALGDIAELGLATCELARVLRPGGCLVTSVVHPVGATRGWTRSFEAAGGHWSVATCWHSEVACVEACASAGLHVERRLEPVVRGQPAALVVRARRMG